MLTKVVQFVVVAVAITLLCLLAGAVLPALRVEIAVIIGRFLEKWATVIGILAGLASVISGASWATSWRRRP